MPPPFPSPIPCYGSWVILRAAVLLFEPTGTHGSLHPVWEKLVTGAVFACALALACLFVRFLFYYCLTGWQGRAGGGEIYLAAPVRDFVSPTEREMCTM